MESINCLWNHATALSWYDSAKGAGRFLEATDIFTTVSELQKLGIWETE
jgi:hypothetical protein